ncbi:MAG: hypothetical protein DLM50_03600 [Candidatus Meridianibacter frigidus]|nr:MAG: hypothetical protein DLM50_03600 [Candidatus Eremiobacteraeota bacterium]
MRLGGSTLRGQLTLVYALALLFGLVLFAGISVFFLDRAEHATLDQRLQTDIRASAALIEARNGKLVVDSDDRKQFAQIVGINASGAVFAAAGHVLTSTDVVVPETLRPFALHPFAKAQTIMLDAQTVRVFTSPIIEGNKWYGTIMVWRPVETIKDLDTRSALVFGIAIPIVLLFTMFFGGVVARRGLAPLQDLAALASEIEAHDLSRRLAVEKDDSELAALGSSFNRMLDRLQAAFERERRFTSDASHELRGPIAVMHAEAELALRRERTTDEYRRALLTVLHESEHVESLTSRLLAAARQQVPEDFQDCDLSCAVTEVCGRLSVLAGARNITFQPHIASGIYVRAEPTSLRQMLFAVLHNAMKYSGEHAVVGVSLEKRGSSAAIQIDDRGPGFSDRARIHAFERFWRDDAARSRGGAGLGLAIAYEIVQRLRGQIRLHNRRSGGASVEIELPVRSDSQ